MRYFATCVSLARAVVEGKIHSSKRADNEFISLVYFYYVALAKLALAAVNWIFTGKMGWRKFEATI